MHHAETLTHLLLGPVEWKHQKQHNEEAAQIFRVCPRLEEVAVSLGPCNLGHWLASDRSFYLRNVREQNMDPELEAVLVSHYNFFSKKTLHISSVLWTDIKHIANNRQNSRDSNAPYAKPPNDRLRYGAFPKRRSFQQSQHRGQTHRRSTGLDTQLCD